MREHWSSRLGFLFAAVGSAVGLGVLWKFPYTVGKNGGGFFLLAYILCVILIGIPVLIGELMLGRRAQRAAIGAFQKKWQIAGYFGVVSSFLIMSFYSIIAGWGISYIVMSLTGFYQSLGDKSIAGVFELLSHAGGITIFWSFFFTAITMGIVMVGVRKGVEYWSRIMTRTLFVLLIILFVSGLRLSGFEQAVRFIFVPDPGAFTFSSALEALGLAFFTLSLGQGIMISYGSYLSKKEKIPVMAGVIGISVILAAILASLTIFPVIFTFDLSPQAGQGLIFKTLPYLFAQMPGSLVLSTLFFTLFVFTALTSAIPFIEVVATNIMELKGWSRKKAVIVTAMLTFVIGIPCALAPSGALFSNWTALYTMNFMETIESLVFIWFVPLAGLLTTIYIGWAFNKEEAFSELHGSSRRFMLAWHFMMRYFIPLTIILIILQKSGVIDVDSWF